MTKRTLLLPLLLLVALLARAQGLAVQSFGELPTDLTANTPGTIVKDPNNGRKCALIKVETTERDFSFDTGLVSVVKTEQHVGEIWVYVPEGVKRISIFHPQLGVLRDKDLGQTLRGGHTYLLRLVAGRVGPVVPQSRTSQYVVFQVEPRTAVVFLDGEMLTTTDGTASKLMRFGSYDYRIQAPDYLPEAGRVTVSDPKQKHVVTVSLKPNFAQVTLSVAGNAEIWVNGQRKGAGLWTGKLGAGTYEIETRLPGHRPATTTRDIVAGTQPLTLQLDAPTPIYGEADINSTPAMADIYIDGKRVGQTPQLVSDLLVGSHQLRLSRQGYQDYTTTINILDGEATSHAATLKQQAAATPAGGGGSAKGVDSKQQELVIKNFEELSNDLTALVTGVVYDQNGDVCALIKVKTSHTGFTWDAGVWGVVKVEQHDGEIWVYVPSGVKRLSILHPQLGVLRDKDLGLTLRGGHTYQLVLASGGEGNLTQGTKGTENGHEWVDLGLSVRWATTNVGANKPGDYGDYFAWAETVVKTTHNWTAYKYCKGSEDTMTKYCNQSDYGSVDNNTTLELSDDAACANWGGRWRMPTADERKELDTKCIWNWTTEDGHSGYRVTGPNGNSIFLPAAGYSDILYYQRGSRGSYWSSSIDKKKPSRARALSFDNSRHEKVVGNRYIGRSVRPVIEP